MFGPVKHKILVRTAIHQLKAFRISDRAAIKIFPYSDRWATAFEKEKTTKHTFWLSSCPILTTKSFAASLSWQCNCRRRSDLKYLVHSTLPSFSPLYLPSIWRVIRMVYIRELPLACYTFSWTAHSPCTQCTHQHEFEIDKLQEEGTLASYCKADKNLLDTYATEDITAGTDADMIGLTHTANKSRMEYAEAQWNTSLRCDRVYDEYVLRGILIEGLSKTIWHSTRSYLGSERNATVHDMTRHTTLLANLQHD